MTGRVPLARRYVFAERRRAAMATAAIAVAFLLVLVLDGIFAGAMSQVTAYIRHTPTSVIVSQSGVRTMHMSATHRAPSGDQRDSSAGARRNTARQSSTPLRPTSSDSSSAMRYGLWEQASASSASRAAERASSIRPRSSRRRTSPPSEDHLRATCSSAQSQMSPPAHCATASPPPYLVSPCRHATSSHARKRGSFPT